MTSSNGSQPASRKNESSHQNSSFVPMLYNFRVTPHPRSYKTFALQQPFATLFDNLIAVLWSVYSKRSKIQIGINQLHWALEFLRCMEVDYSYPESIVKIVSELEDKLLGLYAKVGEKIKDNRRKKELEQNETEKDKNSINSGGAAFSGMYTSYNEEEMLEKLVVIKVPMNPITGEAKYLKDLNSLGKRKPKNQDTCAGDKKSSETYVIGALQKILNKSSEVSTKTRVEELIKELRVENSSSKKST